MIKVFLSSVQCDLGSGMENCLHLRDSNGKVGVNNLKTEVQSGSKVSWELEKKSGIKSITRIWGTEKQLNDRVFKSEPKKTIFTRVHQGDIIDTDKELEGKYNIEYILDNGRKILIDPYIKIIPPPIKG
jgi:hypothetical protein